MIVADEVMSLLLAACPSFAPDWEALKDDPLHSDGTDRLHYLDASQFARHLVALWVAGEAAEVQAALGVIERMHVEGDDYVQELATIGYLEAIQGAVERAQGCDIGGFVGLLGPESSRWWQGLDEFWSGRASTVIAVQDQSGQPVT